MPDYDAERIHCQDAAEKALIEGRDPLDAAIRVLRPSGLVTFLELQIAEWATEAARRHYRATHATSSLLNRPCRSLAEVEAELRRAS